MYRRYVTGPGYSIILSSGKGDRVVFDILDLVDARVSLGVTASRDTHPHLVRGRTGLAVGRIRVLALKLVGFQRLRLAVEAPPSFSIILAPTGSRPGASVRAPRHGRGKRSAPGEKRSAPPMSKGLSPRPGGRRLATEEERERLRVLNERRLR